MPQRWTVQVGCVLLTLVGLAAFGRPAAAQTAGREAQEIFDQAVTDFRAGRLEASATGFDRVAALVPDLAPQLWQRGIALYYVGRYDDCRRQFESHRTVNPNDVENAAWHFLCVARADSPASARSALLPVGRDGRSPMPEIYEMFSGDIEPDDVLRAAGSRLMAQFYAQLYIGLYAEALGDQANALTHVTEAAADRFAPVGGYMHMVARVHRDFLRRAQ